MGYIDNHVHLSGSTPIEVLWSLIMESGYKTKVTDFWEFRKTVLLNRAEIHCLKDYIGVLHLIDKVQSSPAAVEQSVYQSYVSSYLSGCSRQNLRWNPTKRSAEGAIDLDKLIVSARAGKERARVNYGIEGDMILCMGRDCTIKANEALLDKALKYKDMGVMGIDIAGPYTVDWSTQRDLFKTSFYIANKVGLFTTCHAGEEWHEGVEEEIEFVLTQLKPKAIGHGIQIVKYPKLMKLASEMGVTFELCPSSNLATKVVKDKNEMREIFRIFEENSLEYTINTDSTHLLQTDITKEHQLHEFLKS